MTQILLLVDIDYSFATINIENPATGTILMAQRLPG